MGLSSKANYSPPSREGQGVGLSSKANYSPPFREGQGVGLSSKANYSPPSQGGAGGWVSLTGRGRGWVFYFFTSFMASS